MAHLDPRQEIINRLIRLFAISATPISTNAMGTSDDSVSFLRQRGIAGRQVHAVAFKNKSGQLVHFICYLVQNEQGLWSFRGGAGGEVDRDLAQAHLVHNRAWVHLSGGGWPRDFYAGGYVVDHKQDIVRVRLTATNGAVLEDKVENGIALFLTDQQVEIPLHADLYDYADTLVNSHDVF